MRIRTFIICIIVFLTIAFVVQNRWRNTLDISYLSESEIEKLYQKGCEQRDNTLVPCNWYTSKKSPMPAMVAGMIDGAYLAGESIADLAKLTWNYTHNVEYHNRLNEMAKLMWENRSEVYNELKISLKQYGETIGGNSGALQAEYEFGKLVFDAGITLIGLGEIKATTALKTFNKGKWLKRLEKIIELSKDCKPCAALLRQSNQLRNKILKHHTAEIQHLLQNDWKTSGKTWDVFIKDYDAHHIIPIDLLHKSDGLQFYFNNGGKLNFNSLENGIFVKTVAKGGEHARHDVYNLAIQTKIDKIYLRIKAMNGSTESKVQLFESQLNNLINSTKKDIFDNCMTSGKKINEIYKRQ